MSLAMISYSLPFPPISWYLKVLQLSSSNIYIVQDDIFAKMTYRNRYYICGAQGIAMQSVPLQNGRNQRVAMNTVRIDNSVRWQDVQWKTLQSLYKRAPYFDYLAPELESLFNTQWDLLIDFNQAGIQIVNKLMRLPFGIQVVDSHYLSVLNESENIDIRRQLHPKLNLDGVQLPKYWQVFEDKVGFQPNMSILDYLLNEGIHL